ncbi:hypothetical protein HHI36_010852 [Cryptolaemus montrouzieri]|uniref:Transposase n=1 Tax=Cryptolaemus montrouzieri TaxID=559131 RepID=A0ABD2MK37_9CUCU
MFEKHQIDNNMADYSNEDMLNLFLIHGECQKLLDRTCWQFNNQFPNLAPMSKTKFRKIRSNFLQFGGTKYIETGRKPIFEDDDNQINTLVYFRANPHASIKSASMDIGLSYTSIQRILKKHNMHPYSFIRLQKLKPTDLPKRLNFCENLLIRLQEDGTIFQKIIWSDEAKFNESRLNNRRNRHFWVTENPHFIEVIDFQNEFSVNVFAILMNDLLAYHIYEENLNGQR